MPPPTTTAERPPPPPNPGGQSLVRSSSVMAVGTLASRVTGLLRTLVLVPAIGQLALANSYNYANTLPNTVYNLAIGGILTSVIVPLLVNAAKRDSDRGQKYDQRMFTLVTICLLVLTLAATIFAGPIARLYDPRATGNAEHVLVIFAYFFTPQIFFYGITSLAGAILNARGSFAAPMWTPVVNNVVVIAVTVAFMVIAGTHQTVGSISSFEVTFLGVGTTLGIVAQTAALVPSLRKVGFRWRPRFDFQRGDVREIGRMSGWMFGYVLTTQIAYLVTARVASSAGNASQTHGVGAGFSAYSYAWLLFQLPYAVIAISVITALLPRMSANAADRRYDLVRNDFSNGVRLGSVIVAPAALVLAVLGPSLAIILLSYGNNSVADAKYLGIVFAVFSLGLMPYMLFQLLLRVFYALHDSKTPALVGVVTMIVNVVTNIAAFYLFPPGQVVAALGAGFGLANLVGAVVAWQILSRRLGGMAGRQIGRSLVKMHVAALPAALFALGVVIAVTIALGSGKVASFAIVVAGGAGALVIYMVAARVLRVSEVTDLIGTVRSRLGR
jgi:murein biosynthesis integral membrane protein MurJ